MRNFLNKLKQGQKCVVVALGDSITELTWHTRGHLNWVGLLQEAIFENYGRNRCWVINSGRCGDTGPDGLIRLHDDVLRFNPDLVIVSYGMNDPYLNVDLDAFRRAIVEMIRQIRSYNNADILLRTPNPVFNPPVELPLVPGQKPAREMNGARQGEYANELVKIAHDQKCTVVDHYTQWKALENLRGTVKEEPNHTCLYMSDPVHPGPQGHLAFYRQMAPLFDLPRQFPWEI